MERNRSDSETSSSSIPPQLVGAFTTASQLQWMQNIEELVDDLKSRCEDFQCWLDCFVKGDEPDIICNHNKLFLVEVGLADGDHDNDDQLDNVDDIGERHNEIDNSISLQLL